MKTSIAKAVSQRTTPDGFIVVAVLWILGGLSALVSIYAVYVIQTAAGFAVQDDHLRADALTSAAIELTAYQQLAIVPQARPTRGWFDFRLGRATVAVDFVSEAARIDLNAAPKPLLAGLFAVLGARQDAAEAYADRIIGWRTPPSTTDEGEASHYQGYAYGPRGAKFPHVNELALVRDLPPALVERALNFVTVHSGRPQVNVFDAAPEVIAALPGIDRDRINAVLAQRQAPPEMRKGLLSLLGDAQQFATAEGSKAIRTKVRIAFENGHRAGSEAVILLFEQGNEPFSILSWRDGLEDSDTADRRRVGQR